MKRSIFALVFCTVSLVVFAQTSTQGFVEVKNVETRWESYKDGSNDLYGVTFTNKNGFPVTIEAELWINISSSNFAPNQTNRIANTKSFVLQKDEEYTWKVGLTRYIGYEGGASGGYDKYFIKFKAYKSQ